MALSDINVSDQLNYDALRANLELSPTERLEVLRTMAIRQQTAVDQAISYGIDVSLLELALTWTPTERLEKLDAVTNLVKTLQAAGARKHGIRDNTSTPG